MCLYTTKKNARRKKYENFEINRAKKIKNLPKQISDFKKKPCHGN